jgi:hypothetical protein
MKNKILIFAVSFLFPVLVIGGEKEEAYLKEKMIPLAQEFLQRIGQTNQVKSYKLNYFDDRLGCTADMRITNGFRLSFYTESNRTEISSFNRSIKTYYGFGGEAPKEKIEAVKRLNLQNKLNKDSALLLAKKYFKLIGHKEKNFHPPELLQCYWSGGEDNHGGRLPYYEITWYRKDVTKAQIEDHDSAAMLKTVIVEVSGIDSSLISYSKGLLPMGSDF